MQQTLGFWFRRKYNLPPTDPRYLQMTRLDLLTDFWAHHYAESNVSEEMEDEDFDLDQVLAEAEAEATASEWETIDLDTEDRG